MNKLHAIPFFFHPLADYALLEMRDESDEWPAAEALAPADGLALPLMVLAPADGLALPLMVLAPADGLASPATDVLSLLLESALMEATDVGALLLDVAAVDRTVVATATYSAPLQFPPGIARCRCRHR